MTTFYLIWSNEHRAWWKSGERGYTPLTQFAGWYPEKRAKKIVAQANIVPRDPPNEVMVLAPDPGDVRRALDDLDSQL